MKHFISALIVTVLIFTGLTFLPSVFHANCTPTQQVVLPGSNSIPPFLEHHCYGYPRFYSGASLNGHFNGTWNYSNMVINIAIALVVGCAGAIILSLGKGFGAKKLPLQNEGEVVEDKK